MNMHQLLINAKALIDTPEKWIKGDLALDSRGIAGLPTDPWVTCFCSVGAIRRAANDDAVMIACAIEVFKNADARLRGAGAVPLWMINDAPDTDHAQMMAMWDKAITAAFTQQTVNEFLLSASKG